MQGSGFTERYWAMRRFCALFLLIAAVALTAASASAAELVMFRRDGCPYCAAWDRDIAPIYGKTDEGRRVPLRMLDIHRDRPAFALRMPVIYTPTFVLVDQGREIGRIEGYANDSFFWGQIANLFAQLPQAPTPAAPLAR